MHFSFGKIMLPPKNPISKTIIVSSQPSGIFVFLKGSSVLSRLAVRIAKGSLKKPLGDQCDIFIWHFEPIPKVRVDFRHITRVLNDKAVGHYLGM